MKDRKKRLYIGPQLLKQLTKNGVVPKRVYAKQTEKSVLLTLKKTPGYRKLSVSRKRIQLRPTNGVGFPSEVKATVNKQRKLRIAL